MYFRALSMQDVEQIRLWRNESLASLRTSYLLTTEMQANFYKDVICNRQANARYWGIHIIENDEYNQPQLILIGMAGLENIEFENRRGEISLIINPEYHRNGYGEQAVDMLLERGFMYLNLDNIWAECYLSNPAIHFWKKMIEKYNCYHTELKNTKYWNGDYYGSCHFNFSKEDYLK